MVILVPINRIISQQRFKMGGNAPGHTQISLTGYMEYHKVVFIIKQSGH
jgi:hypothetical protein